MSVIALVVVGMVVVTVVISAVYFLRHRSHFWTEVGKHVISGSMLVRGYEDDGYVD